MKKILRRLRELTLAEMALFGGAFLIVVSIIFPSVAAYKRWQRMAMVRADILALMQAGRRFFVEYSIWPTDETGMYGDARYGHDIPNRKIMNVLCSVDGAGNENHSVNSKEIIFIAVASHDNGLSGLDEQGDFLDPWGRQYQMVMDTDLDNNCHVENSIYGNLLGWGMAIWSCGPDLLSDTADDILSWELVEKHAGHRGI